MSKKTTPTKKKSAVQPRAASGGISLDRVLNTCANGPLRKVLTVAKELAEKTRGASREHPVEMGRFQALGPISVDGIFIIKNLLSLLFEEVEGLRRDVKTLLRAQAKGAR